MSFPHEFRNPVMQLAIVNAFDDTRIPLWTRGEPGQDQDALLPNMAVVSDVTVEYSLGLHPVITANLSFPFAEGMKFLESERLVWGFSRLELQFGYAAGPTHTDISPVFTGTLFDPDVSLGEQVEITLLAQGVGYDTSTRGHAHQIKGTREKIIRTLLNAERYKSFTRGLEVDFSEVQAAGAGDDAFDAIFVEELDYAPGYTSDWLSIMRLIKESSCWASFSGSVLRVFPMKARLSAVPRYVLRMFTPPGVPFGPAVDSADGGVWPIVSFESPTAGLFLIKTAALLMFKGVSSETGEAVAEPVKGTDADTDKSNPNLGAGNLPEPSPEVPAANKKTGDGAEPFHVDQMTPAAARKARGEQASTDWPNGLRVEIEILGCPNILPGETVQVKGMGTYFDHNYGVLKITHTLGDGGFTTRLEAYTNTSHIFQQATKVLGETNIEEAEAAAAAEDEVAPEDGT